MTNLLRQLYAMRLLLDGVIGELEPLGPEDEAGAKKVEACPHPEDRQVDATVMGGPPMVLCLACGGQRVGTAPAR